MSCIRYNNEEPVIETQVFVAPGAYIIGQVHIKAYCGIWYNTVIRGDVAPITIGLETNVQDNCVLHVDSGEKGSLLIGSRVTIGHGAILHACTILDESLIGMGATILNEAVIEHHAMVAAGSVVTPGTKVRSGTLFGGVPAKYLRDLTTKEIAHFAESAQNYVEYARRHASEQRSSACTCACGCNK